MTTENQNPTIETKDYNLELISNSLKFVNAIASSTTTKNELVQDTFFDYLSKKSLVKAKMIDLGVVEPKNKDIAKFYFKEILSDLAKKAFEAYNIEIKEVIKEGKDFNYSFTNKDTTKSNLEFITGFKELFKLYKVVLELIGTNNLSLRIKLLDYKKIKAVLDNLTVEIEVNSQKSTLKSAINSISPDLNDIEYLKALDNFIKLSRELKVSENIDGVKSTVQKLTLENKKALLLFLQNELKDNKEDVILEESQSPSSVSYTLED